MLPMIRAGRFMEKREKDLLATAVLRFSVAAEATQWDRPNDTHNPRFWTDAQRHAHTMHAGWTVLYAVHELVVTLSFNRIRCSVSPIAALVRTVDAKLADYLDGEATPEERAANVAAGRPVRLEY